MVYCLIRKGMYVWIFSSITICLCVWQMSLIVIPLQIPFIYFLILLVVFSISPWSFLCEVCICVFIIQVSFTPILCWFVLCIYFVLCFTGLMINGQFMATCLLVWFRILAERIKCLSSSNQIFAIKWGDQW